MSLFLGFLVVIFCIAWLVNLAVQMPQAHIRALKFTGVSGAVLIVLGALYAVFAII